jgi:4-amino-4-deoxy-L-arabinose transferase-like glycosyltransferase
MGGAIAALAALTALRLAVAAWTPLAPDEAYYWVWSRALAPGYLDHPPMVALWIRAGTALAGQSALGVRLLAPLAAALGSALLAAAARDLLPGRAIGWSAGITAAALLNATLLLGVGAVTMTPDTPLLLFWTASLWALGRLLRSGRGAWWLAAGAAAGLALCSKYTAILLLPALALWLLLDPVARPWLRRPWPWAGALLAALIFAPTLIWNARLGWPSFARQGARVWAWEPGRAVGNLLELVGGQIGLVTPLVFLLFAAGLGLAVARMRRDRDPACSLLAATVLVPALVFVQHALGDRVQANWPAVLYPAAAIAAAGLTGRLWNRLRLPAVASGLALCGAVYIQALAAPVPLPRRYDPALVRLGGWPALSRRVDAARRAVGADYVAAESYGEAAEMAWLAPAGVRVIGIDPRWALFALPDARPITTAATGLLMQSVRRTTPVDPAAWTTVNPLGTVARERGGRSADTYRLYRVTGAKRATPAAVLPHR